MQLALGGPLSSMCFAVGSLDMLLKKVFAVVSSEGRVGQSRCIQMPLKSSGLIPLELLWKSVSDTTSKHLAAFWAMPVLPLNSFAFISFYFHIGLKRKYFEHIVAVELSEQMLSL